MDLFRALPDDVAKLVLTYIPTPDLCRYRTVSKGWNELISDLNFAVAHAKNHANCRDASFIVQHCIRSSTQWPTTIIDSYGWCILDVNARRWYKVEGNYRHRDVLLEPRIPMAMDGGLVCQHLKTENDDHISLIVHNPIGNYAENLPLVPKHETAEDCPGLSLVFDTIAKTFQAFVINHHYDKTIKLNDPRTSEEERLRIRNDPVVRVYDSATKEWQSLSNPDWDIGVVGHLLSSAIFQDHLVVLFSATSQALVDPDQPCETLWTYSLAEKTWKIMHVGDFDRYDPKLVVSANRLFLLSWYQRRNQDPFWFSLEEIKIQTEMTRELVSWFDLRSGVRNYPTLDDHSGISVIGFGNSSMMLMSNSSGKCKVIDVVTHSWNAHDLPQNPLGHLPEDGECAWVGKHMNLLPPNWELSTDSNQGIQAGLVQICMLI